MNKETKRIHRKWIPRTLVTERTAVGTKVIVQPDRFEEPSSSEVMDAAVMQYLNEHSDLKQRYDALPLDRMGRGGSTGRGY